MALRSILGVNRGGQSSLGGAKALTFRRLVGVLWPLEAKMAPRPLQESSRTPPRLDFDRFLITFHDFWSQLAGFFKDFS